MLARDHFPFPADVGMARYLLTIYDIDGAVGFWDALDTALDEADTSADWYEELAYFQEQGDLDSAIELLEDLTGAPVV